jgi:hypothetical protein
LRKSMPIHLHQKRARRSSMHGASIFEALVASLIFLIVVTGILPLIAVTLRGESSTDLYTQAANVARAKIEQVKNYSYAELGICVDNKSCPDPTPGFGPSINVATGLAYFEVDPYGDDRFNMGIDYLVSDTVNLQLGNRQVPAIRKVTIEAIDDATDGSGNSDTDGLIDMNTRTMLDYKKVTVSVIFSDPLINKTITQTLSTVISGIGGDDDSSGTGIKPKGGVKPPPPPPSWGHMGSGVTAKSRKGRKSGSNWSGN